MKFSGSILALCLFGSSLAFVFQTLPTRSANQFFSSREEFDTEPSGNDGGLKESLITSAPGDMTAQRGQRETLSGAKSIWDALTPVTIQGGSLKTWSFSNYNSNNNNNNKRRVDDFSPLPVDADKDDLSSDDSSE